MSLYVETVIRGSIDELWQKSQDPDRHAQWDLRFSDIRFLPGPAGAPRRFVYRTRIGFGLAVDGIGESLAIREGAGGRRVSALRFWSDSPLSLIRDGAGYWKYVPTLEGVRFLTRFDYQTRFGLPGKWLDALLFRPLMAWATAWSFDRLRLWIEQGQSPSRTTQYLLATFLCWGVLVAAWAVWLAMPDLVTLLWLLGGSLVVLSVHFQVEPYLPSASRCTWSWS